MLRVRGLRARYGETPWALDGVDLDLAPGRRVAVVGPSGAGKSTLAAVLLRFLDYEGVGHARRRADPTRSTATPSAPWSGSSPRTRTCSTRRCARTCCSPAATRARPSCEAALARARLPLGRRSRGLDTEAGPAAAASPAAQRRRIALARADLAGFPLLILDEPGEHLDAATADAIVADALAGDRGTLLITHRLAGLEAMDEIVVLEAGRVAERGTHAELLRRGGRYAESWLEGARARNTR